jgi:hypothetical protein
MQNKKPMQNQVTPDGHKPAQPPSGPLGNTHLQNKGNFPQNTTNFPQSTEKDNN